MSNDFFEEVNRLLALNAAPDPVVEYRWHYNEQGDIIMCSMVSHPDSTQYIVVDQDLYDQYFRYRVVKGQPELIKQDVTVISPLRKSTTGLRVVQSHPALLLEADETYTDIEYYEPRNN